MSECHSKYKYKQYTIKQKLDVLEEIERSSIRSVGKKRNIPESTIRDWKKKKEEFLSLVALKDVQIRSRKRLFGGGNHAKFEKLEEIVEEFVLDRNTKGITVKNKYIMIKALKVRDELVELTRESIENCIDVETQNDLKKHLSDLLAFKASFQWCSNFKNRKKFVKRAQTSTRKLPENFREIARSFIIECNKIIQKKNISSDNILNMDQIPRYFEHEVTYTIAKKGSRDIFLRKASSSHKKFTFTPTISASGKFVNKHLLFSKLKNHPTVTQGFDVDTNETGMWSELILKKYLKNVILKRPQTSLLKQPTLLLLDSYPVHVKVFNELSTSYEEKYNITLKLIPPNMTGMLQMIDVGLGKSFQSHFNEKYDNYVSDALDDEKNRTRKGNIKMPNYVTVSKWIKDWSEGRTLDDIKKTFEVCGVFPEYDPTTDYEILHLPLRDCFKTDFDLEKWIAEYKDQILGEITSNFFDENFDQWEFTDNHSLWSTLHSALQVDKTYKEWEKEIKENVQKFILSSDWLQEHFDEEEKKRFENGLLTESKIELVALVATLNTDLKLILLDDNFNVQEEFMYSCKTPEKEITLLSFDNLFGFKV